MMGTKRRLAAVIGSGTQPWRLIAALTLGLLATAAVAAPLTFGGARATEDLVAPAPEVAPLGLARAAPVRLTIPAAGVDAPVVPVGVRAGRLVSPSTRTLAGWYAHGTSPGEPGSAVLIGHLRSAAAGPAAFAGLDRLTAGDRIDVVREDGRTASFTVDRVADYSDSERYRELDARPRLRLVALAGQGSRIAPEFVVFATAGS
jgi:hypothetical protein